MGENPLFKKLRILPGQKILVLHAPAGYLDSLGELPEATRADTELKGTYDLVQAFFTRSSELETRVEGIKSALEGSSILWVCYPKGSAKMDTDLNRDILREQLARHTLKAVSLVSIDATWSAMRFKQL
jgi:hypothetical protein